MRNVGISVQADAHSPLFAPSHVFLHYFLHAYSPLRPFFLVHTDWYVLVYVATHVPFPHIFLVSLCLEGNADMVPKLQVATTSFSCSTYIHEN
jgi:hypothetical protein